jgi:hypothetical protein
MQIQCIIYYMRGQVVRYQSASDQFKLKLSGKIEHVAADPWWADLKFAPCVVDIWM